MKTLDEVIIALEVCTSGYCSHPKYGDCPYIDERNDCDTRQRKLDALHYLKEYRAQKEDISNWWIEQRKNPPLSWDELKTMEGKPVWVETSCHKYWGLFNGVWDKHGKPHAMFIRGFQRQEKLSQFLFIRGIWQAYRRERE